MQSLSMNRTVYHQSLITTFRVRHGTGTFTLWALTCNISLSHTVESILTNSQAWFPSSCLLSMSWILRQTKVYLAKLLWILNNYWYVHISCFVLLFCFVSSFPFILWLFASHFPIKQSQGSWRDPICAFQGAKSNSFGTGGAGSRKVTPGTQQVGWAAQEISRQQAVWRAAQSPGCLHPGSKSSRG